MSERVDILKIGKENWKFHIIKDNTPEAIEWVPKHILDRVLEYFEGMER